MEDVLPKTEKTEAVKVYFWKKNGKIEHVSLRTKDCRDSCWKEGIYVSVFPDSWDHSTMDKTRISFFGKPAKNYDYSFDLNHYEKPIIEILIFSCEKVREMEKYFKKKILQIKNFHFSLYFPSSSLARAIDQKVTGKKKYNCCIAVLELLEIAGIKMLIKQKDYVNSFRYFGVALLSGLLSIVGGRKIYQIPSNAIQEMNNEYALDKLSPHFEQRFRHFEELGTCEDKIPTEDVSHEFKPLLKEVETHQQKNWLMYGGLAISCLFLLGSYFSYHSAYYVGEIKTPEDLLNIVKNATNQQINQKSDTNLDVKTTNFN